LTTSVGRFQGIEIDLRDLNAFEVNPNNVTARFQGGAYSHEVILGLWDQGFVTGNVHVSKIGNGKSGLTP
jgi:hypothetical protein